MDQDHRFVHFPKDSILWNPTAYTPSKEIFQAVCDCIGSHYETLGFKYTRSRPKIKLKGPELSLEITFWSSRSNMAGDYVKLEMVGTLYSKTLATLDKEKGNKQKGLLLSHSDFWSKLNTANPPGTISNYGLDNTLVFREKKRRTYAVDNYICKCNIFGIDETGLNQIIQYLNRIFIEPSQRLATAEGIHTFLQSIPPKSKLGGENNRFKTYIDVLFDGNPNLLAVMRERKLIK